ncbi:class I adenylate-forming enzyme family protein [Jatrophihabitans sp.]|uniref:class I adenylate-forming enzyme family protein n=1 Tax=Jatrophihabitans sp. TaxID=1932789 RepID=UPI002BEC7C41|nr:class I adenylate-forming enzyme family protein [Jatrophihabitans sp.]
MASPEPAAGLLARELTAALGAPAASFTLSGGNAEQLDAARLLELAGEFGDWLARQPVTGPRVLLRARNSPGYVVALIGTLLAGGVPMLLDSSASDPELGELVRACGVDLVLDDRSAGPIDGARPPLADNGDGRYRMHPVGTASSGHRATIVEHRTARPALAPGTELCRFTSGSTRTAACIEFSGAAVLAAARSWSTASELTARDLVLCFAGLYNGLAFNTSLIPSMLAGAGLTVPMGLPSGGYVRRQLAAVQPTVLVAFPAIYDALVESATPLDGVGRLRLSLSSAARLSPAVATTLADRDGVRVSDYYGLAETGPVTLDLRPVPGGGQGRPLPHAELVLDTEPGHERELLVRTPSMGTRYLNYPGGFEERLTTDGFYRSGDEGELRDGRLYLHGRAGKGLNINGRKISPDEVRQVLLSHPAVRDCHVLAVQDEAGQPVLAALLVPYGDVAPTELRRHCLDRLASYKVPGRILFASSIPRSGSGKPQLQRIEDYLRGHLQLTPLSS